MYNSSRDPDQLVSHGLNAGDVTTKFSVYITLHLTRSLILSPLPPPLPVQAFALPNAVGSLTGNFQRTSGVCPHNIIIPPFDPPPPPECTLRDHLSPSPPHTRRKTRSKLVLCNGRHNNIYYVLHVYTQKRLGGMVLKL